MGKKEIFLTDLTIYDDIELSKFSEHCNTMITNYKESCLKVWEQNNVPKEQRIDFSDKVIVKLKEEWNYGDTSSSYNLVLELYRWETDEEYEKRLNKEKNEEERKRKISLEAKKRAAEKEKLKKDKDYKKYLELKNKFEKF